VFRGQRSHGSFYYQASADNGNGYYGNAADDDYCPCHYCHHNYHDYYYHYHYYDNHY
jgi:hypothetical protein